MALLDIFWLATYGFAFVGSVSFGYLALRYSMPDIRTLPGHLKLGLASLAGFAMFGVSALVSLFYGRVLVLALLPLLTACIMAAFEIRYRIAASATMRVAVPVAVVAPPTPFPVIEREVVPGLGLPELEEERPVGQKREPEKPPAKKETDKPSEAGKAGRSAAQPSKEAEKPAEPAQLPEIKFEPGEGVKPIPEKKPSLFDWLFKPRAKEPSGVKEKELKAEPVAEKPVKPPEAEAVEKPPEKPAGKPEVVEKPVEKPSFLGKLFRKAPAPEAKPEVPEEKPKEQVGFEEPVPRRRERYAERAAARAVEPEAAGPGPEAPQAEPMSTRRQRYLARRGQLVDEVRYDLAKPHEPQPAPEAKPAAEATLEEISKGIDTSSLEQVGSLDELESLADLQSLEKISDVDLSNLGGLAEIQEIEKPKGAGCPRCSAMHSTVVYCPYCGKGFCSNCSSKVQAKQEMVFYACPSCSKEVIVRKEG